ncbi:MULTISPECIES: hypothetical protein [Micromonospora]|uniref:Uncharacterized protein n=1 Tax=Micromonospora sicca TaxID=2202420 RepID=A0ABU5J8Z1_9ACTN|nr:MULTISPECIES: hypothetical protein [unclassified Micromonospora]MDZ5488990.1 hypothetical protein [Micromonospora sp. 4G53]
MLAHVGAEQRRHPSVGVAELELLHGGEQWYTGAAAQRVGQPGAQPA